MVDNEIEYHDPDEAATPENITWLMYNLAQIKGLDGPDYREMRELMYEKAVNWMENDGDPTVKSIGNLCMGFYYGWMAYGATLYRQVESKKPGLLDMINKRQNRTVDA